MSKNKEYLIKKGNSEYEVIIGLEVHAQVLSKSKLFSTIVSHHSGYLSIILSINIIIYLYFYNFLKKRT